MNSTIKSLIVIIAILIIGVFGYMFRSKAEINSTSTNAISTGETVRIAYLPITQGLPLYLALDKGYFTETGITVEAVKFEAPNQIIDALIAGNADVGAPGTATGIAGIAETKNPDHLRIFLVTGGDNSTVNDAILVKNDSKLTSITDLKGKKLGILSGIQWRIIARHILAQNGLNADKDVTLVELAPGLQPQALAVGQIDALLGVEPVPTIVKAKNMGKEIVHTPTAKYVANPFYGGSGAFNLEFAQTRPDTAAKVLAVFDRAVEEINNDPAAARQYLKGHTPLADDLVSQVSIPIFKMYGDLTMDDQGALRNLFRIFKDFNVVDREIDVQKLLYSPL